MDNSWVFSVAFGFMALSAIAAIFGASRSAAGGMMVAFVTSHLVLLFWYICGRSSPTIHVSEFAHASLDCMAIGTLVVLFFCAVRKENRSTST